MRRTKSFIKTRHNAPADEESKNAQLLIKAGFIYKDAAGVYALLPMGLRVVENIKEIVRREMNDLNSSELLMTSLQKKEVWQQTDRWDDEKVDVWFKSKLKNGTEVGLGWSHEEQITTMMREYISSYRDLPTSLYQFQNKLRNETRAKSGIMRAREFLMKDMYSYSRSETEHQQFYDSVIQAYLRIYEAVGLGDDTFLTFASGGAFTQFSHEFQTVTDAGEDIIYLNRQKRIAVNQEVMSDEVLDQLGLDRQELEEVKASEVGNIFSFGSKKSEQIGLVYSAEDGSSKAPVLGSYGIGITRLMGVVTEQFADNKGLVWPKNLAPYSVYLIAIGQGDSIKSAADKMYDRLKSAGISTIYDDRDDRPGEKFADADLMGIPYRLVISDKTLEAGGCELKSRTSDQTQIVAENSVIETLAL